MWEILDRMSSKIGIEPALKLQRTQDPSYT